MQIAVDLIAAEYKSGATLLAARSLLYGLVQIAQDSEFMLLTTLTHAMERNSTLWVEYKGVTL